MVALEKYHQTTEKFMKALDEIDQDLCAIDGAMYLYEDGAWSAVGSEQDRLDRLLKVVADDEQFPYAEKYHQLWRNIRAELTVVEAETLDKKGWIALPNGTLDPVTGDLHKHSRDHYISRRAAIEYSVNAKCPEWLKMLDRMLEDKSKAEREETKLYLQMWFGLALVGYRHFNSRSLRKMLILEGPPGTAKSSVADVARHLLGKRNIAGESVEQLSSRFGLETVFRSVAIVSDDAAGYDSKVKAEVFKKLITGEPLAADRKMRTIVNFRFHGPILLTTNNLPRIRDATDALHGRTTVLRFTRVFTADDARDTLDGYGNALDFLIAKKEFPGILNWALDGLAMVKETGALPEIEAAKEAASAWRSENDPVYAFIKEHTEFRSGISNQALPVAAAISVYAETLMGSREFPTGRITQILGRQIESLQPGVKRSKVYKGKEQRRCYEGLLLTESGLAYVKLARDRGLLPEKYVVNERVV